MEEQLKPCSFCASAARIIKDASTHLDHVLVGCANDDCPVRPCRASYIRAEAIEAWNCRADGWIPVSERLPEQWQRVLVVTARGYVSDGHLAYGQWTVADVTHWQPLPAAPKAGDA